MIDWQWEEVDTLESQGRWNEAKLLLINSWRENPNNLKYLIRLGFFCWYILVEEGVLGIEDVNLNELEVTLKEVTQFGLSNFIANEDFLWCFGYMISLFPENFGDDFCYWEEKGKLMLKRAYEICPNEPVYKYSYLASLPNSEDLKDELHQVKEVLEDRFQGEGLLSTYFKDIWNS